MSNVPTHTLPVNYTIQNYRILEILGEGGFGITYLARDEVLEQKVAIKEYYPSSLTGRDQSTHAVHPQSADAEEMFKWGLDRFLSEARILAKLSHPNIVRVLYFTSLNNTGYMVMQYEEGEPLDKWVKRYPGGRMPQDDIASLLDPITRALGVVHDLGIAHRDVKPANIYIRSNGEPVLLDFGAARDIVGGRSQTVAAIVSVGYSPLEQYSGASQQGPWTDIYATAAVAYRLITGETPPDAPSRIDALQDGGVDKCRKLANDPPPGFTPHFLAGIDKGLALRVSDRPQSIAEWRDELGFSDQPGSSGITNAETVLLPDRPDAMGTRLLDERGKRESKKGGVGGIMVGGLGLAALAAVGWFAYQQFFAGPADGIGNSPADALRLGKLETKPRQITDSIGGGDARDVIRFRIASPSIMDVRLTDVPSTVDLRVSDASNKAYAPLRHNDRLSYKLEPGEHSLDVTITGGGPTAFNLSMKATRLSAHPDGSGDASKPRFVELSRDAKTGKTTREGILWNKGDERTFGLRVSDKKIVGLSLGPKKSNATLTLIDPNGLSLGRVDSGASPLNATLNPGNYELVATSRQTDPFKFALAITQADPPKPKVAPKTSTKTTAILKTPVGLDKKQAVARVRQRARAILIDGETSRNASAIEDMTALERGIPFKESWSIRWADSITVEADLSASVRRVEQPGAFDARLSETSITAMVPFDVTLTSKEPTPLNIGVYAWGADDSVVRVFPIGAGAEPLRLAAKGTANLSDKVESLISAPMPGASESQEAIIAVGCPEPNGFADLAPAAGTVVEASLAKATDYTSFLGRLADFCQNALSIQVMPYTVSNKTP